MNTKPKAAPASTKSLIEIFEEAITNNDLDGFMALIEEHGLHIKLNEQGFTPFLMCCLADAEDLLRSMLKDNESLDDIIDPAQYFNILKAITYAGSHRCLALLIEAGINVNATRQQDKTSALMFAARYGHQQCVELLLAAGAAVNARNSQRHSAALLAAAHGHYHCLQSLIFAGAELNHFNNNGHSPLMLSAGSGHLDCMALLLENGATLNTKNRHHHSALLLAAYQGHVEACRMLLIWGASCNKELIPRLRFTATVDATTRKAITKLLSLQPQWLYQFEELGYSTVMSLLYRGELTEQALINVNILNHPQQCQTPTGTDILRAAAFRGKSNLLLTAVILLTDGDLLLAADMLSKLQASLKQPWQQTVKNTLALIKVAQRTLNQYQDLASPCATEARLPIELLQTQVLATLLTEIKSDGGRWLEILIAKIISRAALLNHQRRQARVPSSKSFKQLALSHPLLLTGTRNIHQQISRQRQHWLPAAAETATMAIFSEMPLSICPAHVIWQQCLFEEDVNQQLQLLLELLTQHQSPWLKSAAPLVWQQLIINLARPLALALASATILASKLTNLLLDSHTTTSPQTLTQLLKGLAQHQSAKWLDLFSEQCQIIFNKKLIKGINTPQKAMSYYVTHFPEYFDKHHPLIAAVLSGKCIEKLSSLDWQPFVDGLAQLLRSAAHTTPQHDEPDVDSVHWRTEETKEIITTAILLWPFLNGGQLQQLINLTWQTRLATCGSEGFENAIEYALETIFLHTFTANLSADLPFLQHALTELTNHFGQFFKRNDPFIQAVFNNATNIELMDIDRKNFEQSLCRLFASEEYSDLWDQDDNEDAIKLRENTLIMAAAFFSMIESASLKKILESIVDLEIWAGPINACKAYIHHILLAAKGNKNSILQHPEAFIHRITNLMLIQTLLRSQYGMLEVNINDFSSHTNKRILNALLYLIDKGAISLADAKSLFAINNHHTASILNGLSLLEFSQSASHWYANHIKSKMAASAFFRAGQKRTSDDDLASDVNLKRHHS